MNKVIVVVIISICIVSCNLVSESPSNNISDSTIVVKWYYDNGEIKKVQEYSNDSVENGTYLFYYPNGVLKDSAQIINRKFNGERYEYYNNGELHMLTNYTVDKQRSCLAFHPSGTLKYYVAYSYIEDPMYVVNYDFLGGVINHGGSLIYNLVLDDTLNLDKEFRFEMLVANPPNGKTKVEVYKWDIITNRTTFQSEFSPDRFNRVISHIQLSSTKDTYSLNIACFTDTIENVNIVDTLIIRIDSIGATSYFRGVASALVNVKEEIKK